MSDPQSPPNDRGLAGKVAIVTGGGAPDDGIGNGRAAAILLARAGARVLGVDILREAAEQTVAMIEQEGGSAAAFVADVADEPQCRALVDAAIGQFGRLDLLDNNVGIGGRGSVVDTAVEDWRRIMQVNVDSMFLVSRFAIPAMIESGDGGAIVNVSSISACPARWRSSPAAAPRMTGSAMAAPRRSCWRAPGPACWASTSCARQPSRPLQ